MIRFLLAVSVAVIAAPAFAADARTSAKMSDWTGWYAGAQYDFIDGDATVGGAFDGKVYGIFGGYRHDFGDFVIGGELDYSVGDITAVGGPTLDIDALLRVGVEVGYDAGPALIYATLGYATMDLSAPGVSGEVDGVFYGVGADFMVSDRVSLGLEIIRDDFDSVGGLAGNDLEMTSVGLNVSFRF